MSDEQQNSNSQPEQDRPSWQPPTPMEPDSSAPADAPQSPFAAPAPGSGQWQPEQPEQPGQAPYGQTPPQQNPFGQPAPGQNPYGQAPQGQNPYGQAPQGQNPYGQPPHGQPPYGQDPYAQAPQQQAPQQQAPYGQDPYGQAPPGQFQANGPQYGGPQYGGPQPGGPQMGGVPPYGSPQQYGLSGPGVPDGKSKSSVAVVVALVAAVLLVLGGSVWAGVQIFGDDDPSTVSGGGDSGEDPTPEPTPTEEPTEQPTEVEPSPEAPTLEPPPEESEPATGGAGVEVSAGESFKIGQFTINDGWTLEQSSIFGADIENMTATTKIGADSFGFEFMSIDLQFLQGGDVLGTASCLATFDEEAFRNVEVACIGDGEPVDGYDQILVTENS